VEKKKQRFNKKELINLQDLAILGIIEIKIRMAEAQVGPYSSPSNNTISPFFLIIYL